MSHNSNLKRCVKCIHFKPQFKEKEVFTRLGSRRIKADWCGSYKKVVVNPERAQQCRRFFEKGAYQQLG